MSPVLQIFFLSLFIFALALIGVFYPYNRGALFTALIVLYALTACIAGFVASSYYRQMDGTAWVHNILMTCFIYCGPFFLMFMFLNTVAIVYRVRAFSVADQNLSAMPLLACLPACSISLLAVTATVLCLTSRLILL